MTAAIDEDLALLKMHGRILADERTVPRALVHKRAVEQVLLTDMRVIADDVALVAAHVPRCHALLSDLPHARHDLALFGEAFRQSVIALAHTAYDASHDQRFLLQSVEAYFLDEAPPPRSITPQALHGVLRTSGVRRWRDEALAGFEVTLTATLGGTPLLAGRGVLATPTERMYRTLAPQEVLDDLPAELPATTDAPATDVGRSQQGNRIVGTLAGIGDERAAPLLVPREHPVFFDHPQDHVPGMMVLEAMRQVAVGAARAWWPDRGVPVVRGCELGFEGLASLTTGCLCRATRRGQPADDGSCAVDVALLQGERRCAAGGITIAWI